MSSRNTFLILILVIVPCLLSPCVPRTRAESTNPPPDAAELARINELYDSGKFEQALLEWARIAESRADTEKMLELRARLVSALTDFRLKHDVDRVDLDHKRMAVETFKKAQVPSSYGIHKIVPGRKLTHISEPTALHKTLSKPVSMHLEGADLSSIIQVLSEDPNINIIADAGIGKGKPLDIELDDVPLKEMLDYVARNFQVRFYMGRNVIWATAAGKKNTAPLTTRVFHLKKGLQYHGSNWLDAGGKKGRRAEEAEQAVDILSRQATELPDGPTHLENIIQRFVPKVEGSELYLDRTTHTLFVRNTPENISSIAEILEAIDVNPPQVLIEARFIEVTVSDLKELGIDWQLDSDLTLSEKTVLRNGVPTKVPETVVSRGGSIKAPDTPYSTVGEEGFPSSPQQAFGPERSWKPSTADQGLNLTIAGILTEPEFKAVLHMLEVSGKGRTLSVPRVTTVNNNPAKLRDGSDLLYYEEFEAKAFTLLDQNGNKFSSSALMPKGKPKMAELGITLIAVPSVGKDRDTISLLLTPTISKLENFQFYTEEEGTNSFTQLEVKLPTITRRQIQTKVIVESGQTVVMGGLIETVEQDTEHSVPILSSIPLLGKLFTSSDVTELRRNLLIFVTASVVANSGESVITDSNRPSGVPAGSTTNAIGQH
jgi:type IV pilus assembly protein PilQ